MKRQRGRWLNSCVVWFKFIFNAVHHKAVKPTTAHGPFLISVGSSGMITKHPGLLNLGGLTVRLSVCAQGLLWTGGQGLIRATHNHPVPTAPHTWQSSALAITEAIYSPTTAAEWARPIQFLPWREGKTRWMDVTYLKSPVLSLDTIWTTAVMAIWWHRQNTFIMLNAIDKECKTKVDWLALDILHYCFESTYSVDTCYRGFITLKLR